MRTVSYIIVTVAAALLAAGCVSRALEMEQQVDTVTTADGISVSVDALQKGRVRIYVSEETAARLEEDPTFFIRENPEMGITGICRTFPYEEEFEMRTRSRGPHQGGQRAWQRRRGNKGGILPANRPAQGTKRRLETRLQRCIRTAACQSELSFQIAVRQR